MSRKALLQAESYDVHKRAETGTTETQDGSDGLKIEGVAMPLGKASRNGVTYTKESVEEAAQTLVGCPILFNHDENRPLGHVTGVNVEGDELLYEGDVNPNHKRAESLERGDIPHVSIQAMVEETETGGEATVDVQEFLELSAVTIPGFPEADVAMGEAVAVEKLVSEQFEFGVGDFVSWEFGDGTSQGEVVERTENVGDSLSAGGNTFTIEEGDPPLYKMQEWDEEQEQFTDDVVKFEDELSEAERPGEAPSTAPERETVSESSKMCEAFEFDPVPSFVLYDSKESAVMRARKLGLEGVHRHMLDDRREVWMAGETHQEWLQAIAGNTQKLSEDEIDRRVEAVLMEPFAGYDSFDDCVRQNSEKDDPEAYCAAIKRKVEEAGDLAEAVEDVDTVPTEEMAEAASTALAKFEDEDLDNDECGTRVGLERANQLENQEELSPDTVNRMVSFFARHDGDQEIGDDVDNKWEDCGFITWQMWGGDPGREWAERKQEELEDAKEQVMNRHTMSTEQLEQLETVEEDDFLGTVADMYEEVSASDASSLMADFTFSDDPEPVIALAADLMDMTPADLMELAEESTHDDMDDDEEGEAGDMDEPENDDDEEEEESATSHKNNGDAEESMTDEQDGDGEEEFDAEEKYEKVKEELDEVKEMIEELEPVEESKQKPVEGLEEQDEALLSPSARHRLGQNDEF